VIRIIHFIGIADLYHLIVGTYHRPIIARKILMFVDLNNSTRLAEKLGPLKVRALLSKFISDISDPITDNGGDIYIYTGDGLIASWEWENAIRGKRLLRSIDAMFAALRREKTEYLREFGIAPTFRVGIHGGEVVMSEQGSTRRSIGIYGDTINIAARMLAAAQAHAVRCVISVPVVTMLHDDRLLSLGEEEIKGITRPIEVFEYQPRE
jgi:class 3 adenylate cyclase